MTSEEAYKVGTALGTITSASWLLWRWVDGESGDYSEMAVQFDEAVAVINEFFEEAMHNGIEPVHPE